MKVIFLDIDGVLNNQNHIEKLIELLGEMQYSQLIRDLGEIPFDYRSCKLLHNLIKFTESKIVLSSTWRISPQLIEGIKKYVQIDIYDITPRLYDVRGKEIQEYLDNHKEISNYVIIDDDSDILECQMKHFVKVNSKVGLTIKEIIQCEEILKKGTSNERRNNIRCNTNIYK